MTFKVLGAGSQPRMQLHLGSCHRVPVYWGASFAVHAICTTHRDGLAPSQSQPQRTSVAGKRQPDLTSPEVWLHAGLVSGCLAPSPGRGAKPQKRAWVTFQGPANLAAPWVKSGVQPAMSPAQLKGIKRQFAAEIRTHGQAPTAGPRPQSMTSAVRLFLTRFLRPAAPAPRLSLCTWNPASCGLQYLQCR